MLAMTYAGLPGLVARPLDVAIIGGGPCGLATALALSKSRCLQGVTITTVHVPLRVDSTHAACRMHCIRCAGRVEVFESDAFAPKGASIQISKYGWAALKAIDLDAARLIRATGEPVTRISLRSLGGANLTPAPVRAFMAIVGVLFGLLRRVGIRRGLTRTHLWHDVREVLRQRVQARGIALRPSKKLVAISQPPEIVEIAEIAETSEGGEGAEDGTVPEEDRWPEGDGFVRLGFEDGEEVAARLVLACDGASSACRRLLASEPDDLLLDEGKSVWRGQALDLDTGGEATFYKDETGRSGLVFPAGAGQGSSWSLICNSVAGRSASSEEARARLTAALPTKLDRTLRQAIDSSPLVIEGKLQTRNFTKPWASATPRVAFLGDAAHPLRPTGEGTALALEDAWTLGSLAVAAESTDDFCDPVTLRQYEALRGARVEAVSNAVRIAANRFYAKGHGKTSGDELRLEDLNTPGTVNSVDQAFKAHPLGCKPL